MEANWRKVDCEEYCVTLIESLPLIKLMHNFWKREFFLEISLPLSLSFIWWVFGMEAMTIPLWCPSDLQDDSLTWFILTLNSGQTVKDFLRGICKSMQNSHQLHFNTLKLFRSLANLKSWKPVANKQNVNGTTFFNVGPPKEDILFDHLL